MGIKFTNNAISSLASGIASGATSLTVATGDGSKFPVLGGGDYFRATLLSAGNMEIVKVTARTGDVFTVTRAEEGTTAAGFATGSSISLYITNQDLVDLVNERQAPVTATGILKGTGNSVITATANTDYLTPPVGTAIQKAGSGGALANAVAGTDYLAPYGSQTANTFFAAPNGSAGLPSFRTIAVADVPTLNQATTGAAAKWATPRLLAGNSVDGSADVPFANKFIVQGTADAGLSGCQFMGAQSTGLVKNITGTGVLTIATAGLDYIQPQAVTGIVKSNIQTWSAAVPGTDYLAPPAGLSIQKANNGGALANAVPGTDYVSPSGTEVVSNKTLTNATMFVAGTTGTVFTVGTNAQLRVEAKTGSDSASMAFLVPGVFGANLGMDPSGTLQWGGWSLGGPFKVWTAIDSYAWTIADASHINSGSYAITSPQIGVNAVCPAPFTFYNAGIAYSQYWATNSFGIYGLNLYYSAGWKFHDGIGWGGSFYIDAAGGLHIAGTTAASTGAASAATPIDRLYIDTGGIVTHGDLITNRNNDTGVVYLGSSKGHYLYFDGAKFQLFGGNAVLGMASFNAAQAPIAPLDVQVLNDRHFTVSANADNLVQLGSMTNSGGAWLNMAMIGAPYVYPSVDNAFQFGTPNYRWNTIYAVTGTINTSDERLKTDIQDNTLGVDFIDTLRPVSYKWLVGQRKVDRVEDGDEVVPETIAIDGTVIPATTRTKYKDVVTDIPGVRPHFGLIAQDVHSALQAHGVKDSGLFVMEDPADPESVQSLRYDEFIAPMITAIQELSARVKALEAQLAAR